MSAPGFWGQVRWVIRKDLRVGLRGDETLWMSMPFAALALLLAPLALGADTALLRRIGPGMLWLVVLLFGMTVTLRPASVESRPVRDLMTLSGLDPAAGFLGRSLASSVLLFVVVVTLTPVMIVLYAPEGVPRWGWLIAAAVAGTIALGQLGTLVGVLVAGLRSRTALGPLLAVPPAVPVLIAVTRATESAIGRRSSIAWILLLVAMDLALAIAGVLLAGPLDETTG